MLSLKAILKDTNKEGRDSSMKKNYRWLKKHIKCWNGGHDWYYSEYADYWFCKRCKKATKIPRWFKED